MKVVILVGGKGTRISSISKDIPKPMICVEGKPVLEHQIKCLKEQGFFEFIFVTGHLGHIIKEYFKDGSEFGVNIDYYNEVTPLGTAGALYYLKDKLTEDFMLINGDIIFDINFSRFIEFHKKNKSLASLLTHPNNHPYDSALIVSSEQDKVIKWFHKEDKRDIYKNRVNAGIHILSNQILEKINEPKKLDLDRDLLKPLVSSGRIFSYDTPEYIKDMGTPDRYHMVCEDYKTGKIFKKNLSNKQKAIFLDRDGTLNKYCGFVTKVDQIELIEGVAKAVKIINQSGYLAIVITNQPVIARGECTLEELKEIHNKIETDLGKEGAYVDDILFCPHHPHSGYEGERKEYKIECQCRKPKPGLLFEAAEKYNIDLSLSYMIGDSDIDLQAGKAAGCKVALISDKSEGILDGDCVQYPNLLTFVNKNIAKEKS